MFWLVLLFVWLFGGDGFCCCVLFGWLTGFPIYEYGMHKYVVISKTVTIVMMSTAMEQKKSKPSWKMTGLLQSGNLRVFGGMPRRKADRARDFRW